LDGPDANLLSAAIDPQNRFAFFTTWEGKLKQEPNQPEAYYRSVFLKSIRLSDFEQDRYVTVDQRNAGSPSSVVVDAQGRTVYLQTQKGGILKLDSADLKEQKSIGLQPGMLIVEGSISTGPGAAMDPQGKYLYVGGSLETGVDQLEGRWVASEIEGGTGPVAGVDGAALTGVYRVDLNGFKSAGFLPLLNDVHGLSQRMWIDPQGRYTYFGYSNSKHTVLSRIRLDSFTKDKILELSQVEGEELNGALDSNGAYGYFTLYSGKLVQVNLADMSIKSSVDLPNDFHGGPLLLDREYAYIGGYDGQIARMRLTDNTWIEPIVVQMPDSQSQYPRMAQSAVWAPDGKNAYWGFGQFEGKAVIAQVPT